MLDKLPVPERPTNLMMIRQGPTALTVGAGEGCLDIFFSPLTGRRHEIDCNTVLKDR